MKLLVSDTALRVLIVEDDADDRLLIEKSLRKMTAFSCTWDTASTLAEGTSKAQSGSYDLVLLDLFLSDSKALDTFLNLRQAAPFLAMVILTGLQDKEIAREALSRGAEDFIPKNELTTELLERVLSYAVERHRYKQQLRDYNGLLQELVVKDPLTGLLNRRGFQAALKEAMAQDDRYGETAHIFFLDLDDFKKINDVFGHAFGDQVIRELARIIAGSLRTTDKVARIGGDEFLVLLPRTSEEEALRVAHHLKDNISGASFAAPQGNAFHVTASLGLVSLFEKNATIDSLLEATHGVLYESKKSGKDRITLLSGPNSLHAFPENERQRILKLLDEGKDFYTLAQPIVVLDHKSLWGYELFSRLQHAEANLPNVFFYLAHEANIMTAVDHACFRKCLQAAADIRTPGAVMINLFPATVVELSAGRIIHDIRESAAGSRLCLEFSEKHIVGDPGYLETPIKEIRNAGFKVALSGVGLGRNALEGLVILKPDIVKISRRLITGVASDEALQRTLQRIVKITASLGIETVAEGIETQADLDCVKKAGVTHGQGFFLGLPKDTAARPA